MTAERNGGLIVNFSNFKFSLFAVLYFVSCARESEETRSKPTPDQRSAEESMEVDQVSSFNLNGDQEITLTGNDLAAITIAVTNLTHNICSMNPSQQRALLVDVLSTAVANIVCSQKGLDVYAPKKSFMTKSCLSLVTRAAAAKIGEAINNAQCKTQSKKPTQVNGPSQ
jgi:hypothetical protein